MANYPQELTQDAVCQSHTGHMTGLWFLPTQPLRLNTNEYIYIYIYIKVGKLVLCRLSLKCDGTRAETRFRLSGETDESIKIGVGRQFSRLLAAEVCASAVVMLDTTCSEVVWRVLATHSIRQFPLHVPSRASLCAITFQLDCTTITVE